MKLRIYKYVFFQPVNSCTGTNCRADVALADYEKTDHQLISTLGASARAGVSDFGHAKAEANAHVASIEGNGLDGWAKYNLDAGKVGAYGNTILDLFMLT